MNRSNILKVIAAALLSSQSAGYAMQSGRLPQHPGASVSSSAGPAVAAAQEPWECSICCENRPQAERYVTNCCVEQPICTTCITKINNKASTDYDNEERKEGGPDAKLGKCPVCIGMLLTKPQPTNSEQEELDRALRLSIQDAHNQKVHANSGITQAEWPPRQLPRLPMEPQVQNPRAAHKHAVQTMFDCDICQEKANVDNITQLACLHIACKGCLSRMVDVAIGDKNTGQLLCPLQECRQPLTLDDVRDALERGDKRIDIINERMTLDALKNDKHAKQCPTLNCKAVGFINEGQTRATITCPDCKKAYCSNCLIAHPHTISCKEASENIEIANKEWKQQHTKPCPKCSADIEKNGGCNKIACHKCKHNFCWICMKDSFPLPGHYCCPDPVLAQPAPTPIPAPAAAAAAVDYAAEQQRAQQAQQARRAQEQERQAQLEAAQLANFLEESRLQEEQRQREQREEQAQLELATHQSRREEEQEQRKILLNCSLDRLSTQTNRRTNQLLRMPTLRQTLCAAAGIIGIVFVKSLLNSRNNQK